MGKVRMARLLMACVVGLVLMLGGMAGRVAAEEGSEGSSQAYESMQMVTESVSETVYKAYNSTQDKHYETIHEAVADAEANDEIVVVAGEHKLTSTITINKPIVLSGATQGHSLLEIDVNTGKSGIAIMPGADGTRIQGLEIVKTDKPVPAGNQELVYIQANNVTITGNKLHGQYEMGENEVARAMVVAAGVTGLEISDNEIFALRQPAYFSGTSGTVKNNYVYGTRGWVVEQGDWNFQGNTWGKGSQSNYVDIAILANEGDNHYSDIVALSKANNDAVVEDQRVTPAVLSVVHVDAGAVSGGDGTPTKPYTSMSEGVARVVQGGTVHVAEGMYLASGDYIDSIALSKPLRLLGPNAGINPNKSTRNAEAVLKGTISLDTANGAEVVIDGLMFLDDQLGRDHISVYLKGSGDYEIKNCVFERDTGATNDQLEPEKGHMIRAIHIGPASCSAVIENNLFTGSDTNIYRNSSWSSAIWSDSVTSEDGVVIQNNVFNTNRTALNLDNRVDNIEVTGNRFMNNGTHISFGGSPVLTGKYGGISKNKFSLAGAVFNLSGVDPNFRLDAKDNEYDVSSLASVDNAKAPTEMELDELLILESAMYHKGKGGRQGLVRLVDDRLYVTPMSGSIQQALDVADPGDTILVGPGEYFGSIVINKSITLRSTNGPEKTILNGNHASEHYYMVNIKANNVTVDGFTITNPKYSGTADASGVVIGSGGRNSNIRVINCVIRDIGTPDRSRASFGTFGLNIGPVDGLEIAHNRIYNIKNGDASQRAIGIFTWGNSTTDTTANVNIHDNVIWDVDNPGTSVYGISTGFYGTDITVSNNTITRVKTGLRVSDNLQGPATVTGNIITGCETGASIRANVTLTDNKWRSGDSANYVDIAIPAGTNPAYHPNIVALSEANNGAVVEDQRVSPPVLSSVWVDAEAVPAGDGTALKPYATIREALGRVVQGGTINVKPGTYAERLVISKPVTLKGPNSGINPNTMTRGEEAVIGDNDLGGVVVRVESPNVVIDGFTISSGDAGFPVYTGGTVVDGLTIRNNIIATGVRAITVEKSGNEVTILNNRLDGAGYGLLVSGSQYQDLKVRGNVIVGPVTYQGVFISGPTVIDGFEFIDNVVTGAKTNIAADIGNAVVAGNVFTVTDGQYCLEVNLHRNSRVYGNTFNGDDDTGGLYLWGDDRYDLVPSDETEIYNNTFNNCFRGITLSPGNSEIAIGTNTFNGVTHEIWNAARLNGLYYYGIQEAINAASPNDTINVTAGYFTQNVTIPAGKNGLSLVGAGSSLTTIAPPSGNAMALLGNISDASLRPITGITVEGFTLHSEDGCAFIALSGTADGEPYTKNLTLRDIVVNGAKYGICLNAVDGAVLDSVKISNIEASEVGALELTGVSNMTVTNSDFRDNEIAIRLQATDSEPGLGYGSNEGNSISKTVFVGNTVAVENQDDSVTISAAHNYWGTGRTSPAPLIVGNVTYNPWYVSTVMTPRNLSNYVAPEDDDEPATPPSGPTEPPVVAPSVTETVDAETGGTVELEDGSAGVVLPPNAVVEDVVVIIAPVTEVTQPTTGMVMVAGKVFEITAETEDGELVTQFSEPITLTFKLTQEELEEAGVDLGDLKVFYWDEKAGAWIALPTRVDPETGTVTAVTDHFTVFAVMAKPDMPALSDIEGHWGEKDILRLVSLGVVGGYEDGTFRPEAGITRQEFAKMVVLAAGLEPDAEPELTFADSDEIAEWARGYVSAAVKAGIITGVGDNRFAPTDPVTRAQAATMIMRSLGEVETALELTFADAETIPEWAKAAILGAVEKGIVTGFEDNTFKPDLSATRVQAAKMLSKLTVVRFED